MMYPVHIGGTGSFQELVHASEINFGQLSVLTVAPRHRRGGHHHERKTEWFCCLHGECDLVLYGERYEHRMAVRLSGERREFMQVSPPDGHWVTNAGNVPCELLVISSEEFREEDADTYED